MNGPMCMYKLKPLVHFQTSAINLVPSMYTMKNINSSNFRAPKVKEEDERTRGLPNIVEQVNKLIKEPVSEVEELKKRQENILCQLTHLKDQMLSLRDELNKKNSVSSKTPITINTNKSSYQQAIKTELQWDGVFDEIVVFASPESPPYSLLAVNQLWPDVLRLRVSCHVHSSVSSLPPQLAEFSSLNLTSKPNLNIRLIWKQMGPDCESVFSPVNHSPIRGEVNLLRYLHRTINPTSDLMAELSQDSVLDLCHRLNHVRTVHDKKLLVRTLNAQLGKSSWIRGDSMTIADVAAWSTLRSLNGIDFSQNMTKWLTRCSSVAASSNKAA